MKEDGGKEEKGKERRISPTGVPQGKSGDVKTTKDEKDPSDLPRCTGCVTNESLDTEIWARERRGPEKKDASRGD